MLNLRTTDYMKFMHWVKAPSVRPGGKPFFWCGYLKHRLVVRVVWNRHIGGWEVNEAATEALLDRFQNDVAGKKYAETLQYNV